MTIKLVFYKEKDGTVPVMEFLKEVPGIVRLKLLARLELLESQGHLLRRPHCDYLKEGIYELRTRHVKTQYRLLYFFYGREVVVISHGLTKRQKIPRIDLTYAKYRAIEFAKDPDKHSYFEVHNENE